MVATTTASFFVAPPTASAATWTVYYVSDSTGNDQNSGTSPSSPWKSLSKVNATTFSPGDFIKFQAGDTWTGQLWPKGSGVPGNSIQINSYGTGAKPKIQGAGTVADTVRLWNQHHWVIIGLDVSNAAPATATPGENLGDFRGIHVGGDNGQQLDHVVIDSVSVHDVTGEVRWIGGSSTNDKAGIHWGNGWDRSKNTGGIVFNATVPNIASPPATATVFNDIVIKNSSVHNTSFAGIVLKQYTGDAPGAVSTGWGSRNTATDPKFTPFTNVTLENNYITQIGTAYGANGIYFTNVRNGVVQRNLVDRVGTSGIELYATDQVLVQYNEVTGTTRKAGGYDFNGIDTDIATTKSVVQYNYLHDNREGYLSCMCDGKTFGDAVVRYNVIANNTDDQVWFSNNSGASLSFYNNTVYNSTTGTMIGNSWTYPVNTVTNNIFYTKVAGAKMTSTAAVYNNNLYGGTSPTVPSDPNAVIGDPKFANPTAGGTGTEATGPNLAAGLNWKIGAGSAAIDAGLTMANNGGVDYNGATVPIVPDLGAFQHTPPANPTFSDTFDSLATGALATGTNGWTVTSTGNQVDVATTPSTTDKSVHLVRTQNTGGTPGTNLTRTFASPLSGTITVEADVMRTNDAANPDYFGLPYLYNASGQQVISVAFTGGNISAYNGSSLQVLKPYVLGTWYHLRIVADTAQQKFDLYLNGRRVLTGAPFRNSASSIASMAYYANGSSYGDAFVNNVTVY